MASQVALSELTPIDGWWTSSLGTFDDACSTVQQAATTLHTVGCTMYGVVEADKVVGVIRISRMYAINRIAWWMQESMRDRGIMKQALAMLFDKHPDRVEAVVYNKNTASMRLLMHYGFTIVSDDDNGLFTFVRESRNINGS